MSMFKPLSRQAHWLLRIAIASVFIYHGLGKFPMLAQLAEMMQMPVFMVGMVATVEVLGGILVLAGGLGNTLLTRIGSISLVPVMLGAIFMVHWGQWSFMATKSHPMGGVEFQVTLTLILLYLFVTGGGTQDA